MKKRGKITLQTRRNHGCNRTSTSAVKNRRQHTCTKQKANLDNVVKKTKKKITKQVDWGCLRGCNRKSPTNNITNTHIRIQKQNPQKKKTMQESSFYK